MPFRNPDGCPADPQETAESYLFEEMTREEASAFQDHYLTCPRCAGILQETEQYVLAMTQAARRLRACEER